jgi:phosphoserine phosphatase
LQISPGIPELVTELRAQGKEVFLVSGGFRAVIHPIAEVGRGFAFVWN